MIAQSLLPEFDHEFKSLRALLERVPEDKPEFTPHEKSMTLARLAGHCAELVSWMDTTIETDELDFAEMDYKPYVMESRADMLKVFDEKVGRARESLTGASDQALMENWTMRTGDTVHMTMPKIAVIRSFVMNHMVHHRAQLGVYLRMNGVALPPTYGPSADETGM